MMLWAGLLLGLLLFQALRMMGPGPVSALSDAPLAAEAPLADPYAESRRSRAILEAQEGIRSISKSFIARS